MIWDNETVFRLRWRNQRLVNAYRDQEEWRGVADVVRYEILHQRGGFMPGALGKRCVMPLVGVFISRCMSRQGSGATGFDDK
jgi:hypothetical protein